MGSPRVEVLDRGRPNRWVGVAAAAAKLAAAGTGVTGVGSQDGETWRSGSSCPGGGGKEDVGATMAVAVGSWAGRAQPRSNGAAIVGAVVTGGKEAVAGGTAGRGECWLGSTASAVRSTGGGTGTRAADGSGSSAKVCCMADMCM